MATEEETKEEPAFRRKLRNLKRINYNEKTNRGIGSNSNSFSRSPPKKKPKVLTRRQRKKHLTDMVKELESKTKSDFDKLIEEFKKSNEALKTNEDEKKDSDEVEDDDMAVNNADLSQLGQSAINDCKQMDIDTLSNKYFTKDSKLSKKIGNKKLSKTGNTNMIAMGNSKQDLIEEMGLHDDGGDDTSHGNTSDESENDNNNNNNNNNNCNKSKTKKYKQKNKKGKNGKVTKKRKKNNFKDRKPPAIWTSHHIAVFTIIMKQTVKEGAVGGIEVSGYALSHLQWKAIQSLFVNHTGADPEIFTVDCIRKKWNAATCGSGKDRCPTLHKSWAPIKEDLQDKLSENNTASNKDSVEKYLGKRKREIKEKSIVKSQTEAKPSIESQIGDTLSLFNRYLQFNMAQSQSININSNNTINTTGNDSNGAVSLTSAVDASASK